jgi:hypothetical protein
MLKSSRIINEVDRIYKEIPSRHALPLPEQLPFLSANKQVTIMSIPAYTNTLVPKLVNYELP